MQQEITNSSNKIEQYRESITTYFRLYHNFPDGPTRLKAEEEQQLLGYNTLYLPLWQLHNQMLKEFESKYPNFSLSDHNPEQIPLIHSEKKNYKLLHQLLIHGYIRTKLMSKAGQMISEEKVVECTWT